MKKTISITLAGRVYAIEEDGYAVLDAYLKSLRQRFAQDGFVEELLADIEGSIGEKFSQKLNSHQQAITLNNINEVIAVMGKASEIADEESSLIDLPSEEDKRGVPKRFYRDPDNKVIAGVSSGLAAYLGIDPLIVRILFILLTFLNGIGIIVYLVLWMVVPIAQTSSQKLEMRGRSATLNEIQELVKEKGQAMGEEGRQALEHLQNKRSVFRTILNAPIRLVGLLFKGLKRILTVVGPVLRIILGVGVLLFSVLGITAINVLAGISVFRINSPYIMSDVPLAELATKPLYYVGVGSVWIIGFIPLLFGVFLGVSLIRKKNHFRGAMIGGLLALWVIAAGTAAVSASELIPWATDRIERSRQENTITRSLSVSDFTSVKMEGRQEVEIRKGDTFSIQLTGSREIVDSMEFKNENGVLTLRPSRSGHRQCFLCFDRNVSGIITMPVLESYQGLNESQVRIKGFTNDMILHFQDSARGILILAGQNVTTTLQKRARVELRGKAAALTMTMTDQSRFKGTDVEVNVFELSQADYSDSELEGKAKELKAILKDSARFEGLDFEAENIAILTHDQTRADVFPSRSLNATSTDHSRIFYENESVSTTLQELRHGRILGPLDLENRSP